MSGVTRYNVRCHHTTREVSFRESRELANSKIAPTLCYEGGTRGIIFGNLCGRFHHHFCLAFPSTVAASPSLGLVFQIAAARRTFFLPVFCRTEAFCTNAVQRVR
ncbi:hypothetical protein AVEN_219067-1 [Araneus ventricosus]|uniref:Uncharacterized protein n=1 Tax=Araneus ventricosus TaxID=182803 RepID=A0A4Y2GAT2_ARAVE|nr:hypothetical protein AVEN_219067-1 [Araneus ventricosus]